MISRALGGGFNGRKICHNIFDEIISLDNLFLAWQEFRQGKRSKPDVQEFEFNLEDNLFQLCCELESKTYHHFTYTSFNIQDPKLRRIHKACVKDRVLHHAIFRVLYPIFDPSFIFDSYSCRKNKGTHRAVSRLESFAGKLSKNHRRNIFVLKCDIKKFFDSIDQDILFNLVKKQIQDEDALWLIQKIIQSFKKEPNQGLPRSEPQVLLRGLPLGNVTSQLFANIYLNEFDQFIKHKLKIRYYLRYCDDFIILDENKENLVRLVKSIQDFLSDKLKLSLHPNKITVRKYRQGVDFLGYVALPHYRVLRTKTKRRILKKIKNKFRDYQNGLISKESFNQSLQSYLGVLRHCEGRRIKKIIKDIIIKNIKF